MQSLGGVESPLPTAADADSSPLISSCYRRTVAFRSGARLSFTSVTPSFHRLKMAPSRKQINDL